MSVAIEFVGHACFRLWQDGIPKVLVDPYKQDDVKLPDDGRRFEAETVIVSSLTDDSHNNYELAAGNPHVINALDVATGKVQEIIQGEPVIAIPAAENPAHPTGPDDNGIYAFSLGGIWFAHLGDLGFGLPEEELAPWVGHCDALMAIVGEKYSLTLDELDPIIDFLQPRWVFPMHYQLPPVAMPMSPLETFLRRRRYDPVIFVRDHTVTLPIPQIDPDRPTIVVLKPSGYLPTEQFL